MKEKEKSFETIRENPWIVATFFLGIICLILMVGTFHEVKSLPSGFDAKAVCSSIKGTPAWVDENETIIDYGYKTFGDQSIDVVNVILIPNKVHFVYSGGCGWCKKQIEYFGITWGDYVTSGLTHDCLEERK